MTSQNIPANISERYVSAVERDAARAARYNALLAAQHVHAQAKRTLEDAEYALQIAQNNVDDGPEHPDA